MSDNVFVDAAAPLVFFDDAILAFFKATLPETWFYTSRAGRIAMDGDKYRLVLVRNRKKVGGGLETKGGMLATQINLAPVIGSVDDEKAWTEAIKRDSPFVPPSVERLTLRPLGLRNGRMTIGGLEGLGENPAAYRDIPIGVQTSLPITLPLTADGADTAWGILGTPAGLPVTVRFDYDYDVLYPGAHYKITAETHKVYDYFSVNAKARASYFGLVGAQADLDLMRSELTSSGIVAIEWLVRPEGFDDSRVAQLQSSILDAFAKSALDLMVQDVVPDREAPRRSRRDGWLSDTSSIIGQVGGSVPWPRPGRGVAWGSCRWRVLGSARRRQVLGTAPGPRRSRALRAVGRTGSSAGTRPRR